MKTELRKLPAVDKLLAHPALHQAAQQFSHPLVLTAARSELEAARHRILTGAAAPTLPELVAAVLRQVSVWGQPSLQPVINATGVIIHTNLGRALLSRRAQAAMRQAAAGYSNLEYDLEAGGRGSRYVHAADLLCRLTGAEAAVVVNNNAGAVILALTALAQGREVVISRGQLVEIGGGFRIPEIMAQSGARLVEVGTTNRTYVSDYEQAIISGTTGLLLTVHHSNYQVTGFTARPALPQLVEVSRRHHLPLLEDLGSGTLLDTAPYGLAHEPTIQESLTAGVDLVTASGDKLLGGPQAGIILGRADLIQQLKQHPLIRALRVDKTTLAALQATLLAYLENKAVEEIPVWQMIAADQKQLARRAKRWQKTVRANTSLSQDKVQVVSSFSAVGGGSLPGQTLPTAALSLRLPRPDEWAARLRHAVPPVITRIENDALLLDPRTVLPEQDKILLNVLQKELG